MESVEELIEIRKSMMNSGADSISNFITLQIGHELCLFTSELIFKHVHNLSQHIASLFSELNKVLLRASQLKKK